MSQYTRMLVRIAELEAERTLLDNSWRSALADLAAARAEVARLRESMKVLIADTRKWQNNYDKKCAEVARLWEALKQFAALDNDIGEIAREALGGGQEDEHPDGSLAHRRDYE